MLLLFILSRNAQQNTKFKPLKIADKVVLMVELASNEKSRQRGYSGRPSISYQEGMLFVFPLSGYYPFWMKDMLFNLDFIFINKQQIVYMLKDVPSPANNKGKVVIVGSKEKFDKVLEVKSGFVNRYKIKIGDKISY